MFLDYWAESTSEDRLEGEEFGCYQARHISDLHSNIPSCLFIILVSISYEKYIYSKVFLGLNHLEDMDHPHGRDMIFHA